VRLEKGRGGKKMKRNYYIVVLIFIIFFVISLLTNILGPIIPDIIKSLDLSLTLAAFLPFSFFVAYGVMSIPAGMLVEKYREKPVLLASFMISFIGAIMLALFPYFLVALISLFLIGIGMAILQVAINPLLRVSGGEEHFAFNSVFAQLIFGGASFLSPFIYSYLVTNINRRQPGNFVLRFPCWGGNQAHYVLH
jgi:MFS transporter, FHS family, L-fucose permease